MKHAQKVLGHGLLIAFIVAAFFASTNRLELIPHWFGTTVPVTTVSAPVGEIAAVEVPDKQIQSSAPASGFQEDLERARAYFWHWDLQAALKAYQNLAESYPRRPQVWGELGNLYFNIGQAPAAVNAYAHATELLIEQGDATRILAMLTMMYRLDAKRARQFEMRLREAELSNRP